MTDISTSVDLQNPAYRSAAFFIKIGVQSLYYFCTPIYYLYILMSFNLIHDCVSE